MKGFVSYAHDDHADYRSLRTHLKPIERAFGIELWGDQRLVPGDYWDGRIKQAIDAACLHLLVVSPSFIASDYIFDHELPAINAKYLAGDLVVPIIVQRCSWQPFISALQAAPSAQSGRLLPIDEWRPKRNGFDAAREQVTKAIAARFGIKPKPGFFGTVS